MAKSKSVYLPREVCDLYGHGLYYGPVGTEVEVVASDLLRQHDYDRAHRKILSPLEDKVIRLVRTSANPPGWFTLQGEDRG